MKWRHKNLPKTKSTKDKDEDSNDNDEINVVD